MAQSFASRVLTFPKRRPVLFGVGFSATKTSFADFLVQRYVEKREEIDLKRNLTFGLFGLGYLGAWRLAASPAARCPRAARPLVLCRATCHCTRAAPVHAPPRPA